MNSQPTPTTAAAPDLRALSGLLWTLGGLLVSLAAGLMGGAAEGVLTLGVWCLATAWRMGARG